jgi:hypothetical protein
LELLANTTSPGMKIWRQDQLQCRKIKLSMWNLYCRIWIRFRKRIQTHFKLGSEIRICKKNDWIRKCLLDWTL